MFVICQLLWIVMMSASFWCVLQVVAAWCFILSAEHCESPELFLVLCLKYPEKMAKQVLWKLPWNLPWCLIFFGKQRFGLKKRWTWMIFAAKCLESCAEDRNLDKHVCSLPRGVRRRLCSCALAAKVSCASCSLKVIKLEHFHNKPDMNRHDPLESIVAWIA